MPHRLTITESRRDGVRVLTVVGEIDLSNAYVCASALAETGEHVVVDLTDVTYLDSAGLTVLFTHAHHIELVVGALVAPVLTVSGLTDLVTASGPTASDD